MHSERNKGENSRCPGSTFISRAVPLAILTQLFVKKVLTKLRPDKCLGARVAPPEEVSFTDGGALREERWDRERRSRSLGGEVTNSFTRRPPVTNQHSTVIRTNAIERPQFMGNDLDGMLVSVNSVKPPPPTTREKRGGDAGG